MLFVIKSLPLN